MNEFLAIPSELIVNIFLFIGASDLVSLCKTCCRFRSVMMDHDHIWQKLCFKDYGVQLTSLQGWSLLSYRELYTLVLYRYGPLLGLWKLDIQFYGGLVHIHVKDGKIIADQCCPPTGNQVANPLRIKPLFELTYTQRDQVVIKYLTRLHSNHDGSIAVIKECNEFQIEQFSFVCHHKAETEEELTEEQDLQANYRQDLQQWVKEEYHDENYLLRNPHLVYGVLNQYAAIKDALQNPLHFNRIILPSSNITDGCVLSPGIYKGTYSSHGIELILVTDCKENVLGTKLTGDPNVPAGKMSFDVDLGDKLQEEGAEESAGHSRFPFHLPQDYHYGEVINPPAYYTARFKGYGQIAGHGFLSPRKSPLHMYVISNTMIGLLWIELRCFSIFSRVDEEFLQS